MEKIVAITQEKLNAQEQQVRALINNYKATIAKKEALRQRVERLVAICLIRKRQREDLQKLMAKDAQTVRAKVEDEQKGQFEGALKKIDFCTKIFEKSLEKISRLEKLAPHVFDQRMPMEQLQQVQQKALQLEQESRLKRDLVKKQAQLRSAEFQATVQQAQIVSDILWEITELKKEEEENEAMYFNRYTSLARRNSQMRKRLLERDNSDVLK